MAQNVYWTDGLYRVIGVKPLAMDVKLWKVIVDSNLTSPQDIVVNPLLQ